MKFPEPANGITQGTAADRICLTYTLIRNTCKLLTSNTNLDTLLKSWGRRREGSGRGGGRREGGKERGSEGVVKRE